MAQISGLDRARAALEAAEAVLAAAKSEEEFLRHAVAELDKLDPQPGEEGELDTRRRAMQGAERIREDVARALQALGAEGAEGAMLDALGLAEDRGFRVYFEAARVPAGSWWRLDGERLAAGNGNGNGNGSSARLAWRPVAGRHLLELMSAEGAVLDSVSFAVRGPGDEASKPADQQPHQ